MARFASPFAPPRRKPNRRVRVTLRLSDWPDRDQEKWEEALLAAGPFDDAGRGAHLAERTQTSLSNAYGRWLGFLANSQPVALAESTAARVTRDRIKAFADHLAETNRASSIASQLRHLRGALRLLEPNSDWEWLLIIAKRIAAGAEPRSKRDRLRTSDELLALGRRLMTEADEALATTQRVSKEAALLYRDGLIIALLSSAPMRKRNLASLTVGHNLQRFGPTWRVILHAGQTKTRREQEYELGSTMSAALDRYLQVYRPAFFGSSRHGAVWASAKGVPLTANAIYDAVSRRTTSAFGKAVGLHLFRDAAATWWALRAPAEIAGASALLGHAHPKTLRYYNQANSIEAGRYAAEILLRLSR